MAQPKCYPWTRRWLYHENFFKVFPPYRRNRFCLSAVSTNTPSPAWQWKLFPSKFPDVESPTQAGPNWCLSAALGWCWCAFVVVFRSFNECVFGWVSEELCGPKGAVLKRKGGRKSESDFAHRKNRSSMQRGMNVHFSSGQLFVGWDRPLRRSFFFLCFLPYSTPVGTYSVIDFLGKSFLNFSWLRNFLGVSFFYWLQLGRAY